MNPKKKSAITKIAATERKLLNPQIESSITILHKNLIYRQKQHVLHLKQDVKYDVLY